MTATNGDTSRLASGTNVAPMIDATCAVELHGHRSRSSFKQIAEVVDMGHALGVDQIGLMTPKVLAGQ